jgi:hypothetical protein
VAPNITCLTPEQFSSIYGSEPSNSRRLEWITLREPDNPSTLLLPSQPVVEACDPMFEKEWGFEKFSVQRYGGIYLRCGYEDDDADEFGFIDCLGKETNTPFVDKHVFGPRGARLADLFKAWAGLVRDGTWKIDENGVSGPVEMQFNHRNQAHSWLA